jgi:hypothetical protein
MQMSTKLKLVLATVLLLGAASAAAAQEFDPNLANRYPAYAEAHGAIAHVAAPMHQQDASLRRNYTATHGQPYEFSIDQSDRASSPYAGS